jgi:hypothetical protein
MKIKVQFRRNKIQTRKGRGEREGDPRTGPAEKGRRGVQDR